MNQQHVNGQIFNRIFHECHDHLPKYPHWETYYYHRYLDFLAFYRYIPPYRYQNILEIGCGGGYHSAFLAAIGAKVTATDLAKPKENEMTPGTSGAKQLLDLLKIKNVEVQAASAEELPFQDQSFDLVYSCYCLEHVPDRKKALEEIYRVLKPGGINFCVVPTSQDRFYYFFGYYAYLFKRAFYHLFLKKNHPTEDVPSKQHNHHWGKRKILENFPFPPTHGAFSHYLSELINWRFAKWQQLILANGKFELIRSGTSDLTAPITRGLSVISPLLADQIFAKLWKINYSLGKWPLLKRMGINGIFVTRKK